MKISREDVLRVAELAHLGLSPEEVEKFQAQLDGILNYIDKLNQLDVSQVEPMEHGVLALPVDRCDTGIFMPQRGELSVLHFCGKGDATIAVRIAALLQQRIVEMTRRVQHER